LSSLGGLVITAVGAATSLGGAVTAAAGFRAGVSRPIELDEWQVVDSESGDAHAVSAHCVEAVAGFHNPGRLVCLAALGLSDLLRSLPGSLERTQLVLAVPDFRDRFLAHEDLSDEERREAEQEFFEQSRRIVLRAAAHAGIVLRPEALHVSMLSAAGFRSALERCRELLERGHCDRCLVGAVDSLLDPDVLELLDEAGRLKTPEQPVGAVPGEAAAFLCLERDGRTSAPALARWSASAGGQTHDHRVSERPPSGAAWASSALSVLGNADTQPFFVVQHSGESHSAHEWGEALVHLQARQAGLGGAVSWFPAVAFGEVGAAFTPLSMVLACRAWQRRYAPAATAVVLAGSDAGERAAIRLDAPSNDAGAA
jgi:3-oxoacyl-[acyl-carrier-protein] synthase I